MSSSIHGNSKQPENLQFDDVHVNSDFNFSRVDSSQMVGI